MQIIHTDNKAYLGHLSPLKDGTCNTPNNLPPVVCPFCGEKFIEVLKRSKHVREKHADAYKCKLCNFTHWTIRGLNRHVRKMHNEIPEKSLSREEKEKILSENKKRNREKRKEKMRTKINRIEEACNRFISSPQDEKHELEKRLQKYYVRYKNSLATEEFVRFSKVNKEEFEEITGIIVMIRNKTGVELVWDKENRCLIEKNI
ncbi:hypothetical protein [Treponema sp.]|uniref:hypothetical protein n=1 Tax=Treponema sp. TaxID=166 RepID=UPI00298E19D2|nr:hypothetical protein [Treponema sp.]MCQ2241230.1 C2H2-type zinc finger protein [Treponema sp.]